MPVDINVSVRCTSKSLISGGIPAGGGTPTDSISVQCQLVQTTGGPTGNLSMNFPLAEDHFVVGGYYALTMVDGTAPTGEQAKDANGAFTPPQRTPMPRG